MLSQMNPFRNLSLTFFFAIHSNIIILFILRFFELFFSFKFLYQITLRISVTFHACYLPSSFHPPCFSYQNYIGKNSFLSRQVSV